ncbi:IS701 family transposase [Halostreptopolyspora alba]|uniref:IS701 family transposase n=1 Tax=Halostreptopolyspora alba TaxID=2487137 RepID=UPI00371EE9C9
MLRRLFRRLEGEFSRAEPRRHAYAYVCSLLSEPMRGTSGGEDGRNRMLTTARWDENRVRDRVRDLVVEYMGGPEAVLVITEEGFQKKGDQSAGVAWQHCFSTGRVDNCQIGLFLLHVDSMGTVSAIDRELLIPPSWSEDSVRSARAGVPWEAQLRTRDELALAMVERALDVRVQTKWVVADSFYCGDSALLREALERRRIPYVLASSERGEAATQTSEQEGFAWWRFGRWGGGSYRCFAPVHTNPEELASAAEKGAVSARYFASARNDAGMDRYSVRRWRGWYRHMTLSMFAHACLLVSRPPGSFNSLWPNVGPGPTV